MQNSEKPTDTFLAAGQGRDTLCSYTTPALGRFTAQGPSFLFPSPTKSRAKARKVLDPRCWQMMQEAPPRRNGNLHTI